MDTSISGQNKIAKLLMKDPAKAFELFNTIDALASASGNSKLAKDWRNVIGDMTIEDLMSTDEVSGKHGYAGWTDYFNEAYGKMGKDGKWKNPTQTGYTFNRVVLPNIGTAVDTAGKAVGAYKSILGGALAAMANNVQDSEYDRTKRAQYDRDATILLGALKGAEGAVISTAASGVGNILKDVGNALNEREEKAKMMALQINESPSGKFYDQQGRLERRADSFNK